VSSLSFLSDYKYVFLVGFCVLCGIQFFISRRKAAADKIRDRA
jgi:hypothetical protein